MTKERRLGRGLEALLGQIPSRIAPAMPAQNRPTLDTPFGSVTEQPYGQPPPDDQPAHAGAPLENVLSAVSAPAASASVAPDGPLRRVEVGRIDSNPEQPRQSFDPEEMKSLAESIVAHGLLQPVVVRKVGDRYQLIAGERRLRAAIEAGCTDVPVHVIEADDRQLAELAVVENLHRKDLNPLEKAASFQRYLDRYGCTQEDLAGRVKIDRSTIANLIRLLELPEAVQQAVRAGKITQGHARALLPLGEEREQAVLCERIQREGLSVRQTEALVEQTIDAADTEPLAVIDREGKSSRPARPRDQHIAALEQEFRAALGLKVKITHNARGRGKLVVQFRNHEEFEALREFICGTAGPAIEQRAG